MQAEYSHNCAECVALGKRCRRCQAEAMMIGQLQHIAELLEQTGGRNIYDPLFVDFSTGASAGGVALFPSEHGSQIEFVTITTDTACVVTITLAGGPFGAAGKSLKINLPANPNPAPIPLNWSVPPVSGLTLTVAGAPAPAKGYAIFTLAPARAGRYPYVA